MIHEDQSGFVPGRYIGDNLRLIYDMIHYLNNENLPGLFVSIDFEKAFDSIDWKFMQDVLKRFGFGDDIIQWVSSFYNDIRSSVQFSFGVSLSYQQITLPRLPSFTLTKRRHFYVAFALVWV